VNFSKQLSKIRIAMMIVNLCHGDGTWYNQKSNYSIEVSNETIVLVT